MVHDRIEKQIDLKAPVSRVWRALTDPVEFGSWFQVAVEGSFIPGKVARGRITYPGYEDLVWEVTVVRVEPETCFSFTWHPYGVDKKADYSKETPTLVEFRLAPTKTGTRLTLIESGFDKVPSSRRQLAYRMNDQGWKEQMANIEKHVAKG